MELIVAGTAKGLLMVEGSAQFVSEAKALEALKFAHQSMTPIFEMQEDLRKKTGNKTKREITALETDKDFVKQVQDFISKDLDMA